MDLKKPKMFKRHEEVKPINPRKQRELAEVRSQKLKRIGKILLISWILLGTLAIAFLIHLFFVTYEFRSPIVKKEVKQEKIISPLPETTPTPKVEEEDELSIVPQVQASEVLLASEVLYQGKVSHYSHAGCLGCGESQTMGNGEAFDENAMTLAIPCEDIISKKHRYNTNVLVTNLDNGKSVEARITDCGGFSKYNRIADLSLGMAILLETKTDVTNVKIEKI